MKTMTARTMRTMRRLSTSIKAMLGKKLRLTPNHNGHIITPHGKVFLGRKGRKA